MKRGNIFSPPQRTAASETVLWTFKLGGPDLIITNFHWLKFIPCILSFFFFFFVGPEHNTPLCLLNPTLLFNTFTVQVRGYTTFQTGVLQRHFKLKPCPHVPKQSFSRPSFLTSLQEYLRPNGSIVNDSYSFSRPIGGAWSSPKIEKKSQIMCMKLARRIQTDSSRGRVMASSICKVRRFSVHARTQEQHLGFFHPKTRFQKSAFIGSMWTYTKGFPCEWPLRV